jgi:hypothetical protein
MVPDMPYFCNEGIEIIRRNAGVSLALCPPKSMEVVLDDANHQNPYP